MNLMYPLMDQMQAAVNAAQLTPNRAAANQNQSSGSGEFDAMVRQKRQEVRGQDGGKTEAKAESRPEARAGTAQEVRRNAEEAQTPGEEQVSMAAALLLQMQPNVNYVEIRTEEVTEVLPEVGVEAVETAEIAVAAVLPETADAPAAETAELPVQTVSEERPVFSAEPEEAPVEFAPERAEAPVRIERPENVETAERPEVEDRGSAAETVRRVTERRPEAEEEDTAAETPVFAQAEAAPVKVAEPAAADPKAPVALERENGIEQLGAKIENLIVSEDGSSRVELTLTPENLGTVTVEITRSADGSIHVQLSASTERAANLLERGTNGLQNLLSAPERPAVQVSVRGGEEAQQQFLNPNDSNGQNRQQQQQQQRQQQSGDRTQEFLQQLRLGLVDLDGGTQ